jgi:dynein heavy chain
MFLISDTQLVNDLFLKDLNLIICSGDIPTLFSIEEKTDIFEKMQNVAKDMVNVAISKAEFFLYYFFVTN